MKKLANVRYCQRDKQKLGYVWHSRVRQEQIVFKVNRKQLEELISRLPLSKMFNITEFQFIFFKMV